MLHGVPIVLSAPTPAVRSASRQSSNPTFSQHTRRPLGSNQRSPVPGSGFRWGKGTWESSGVPSRPSDGRTPTPVPTQHVSICLGARPEPLPRIPRSSPSPLTPLPLPTTLDVTTQPACKVAANRPEWESTRNSGALSHPAGENVGWRVEIPAIQGIRREFGLIPSPQSVPQHFLAFASCGTVWHLTARCGRTPKPIARCPIDNLSGMARMKADRPGIGYNPERP